MSGYLLGEERAGVYVLFGIAALIALGCGYLIGCVIADWRQDRRFR